MPIVYRTDGTWGTGKGSNLAPNEVDNNFFDIDQRVTYWEDNPPLPIAPVSITISGYAFTMGLSNGETLGPVAMTMPVPTWRGDWSPATTYVAMDYIIAPDGGFGAAMQGHTSSASFDWAAVGTNGLPLYREIVGSNGTTAKLGDLTDVALTGIATGHMLSYDAASQYWVNVSPAELAETFAVFEGDTGAGGTAGMVPAPGPGDAAAGKVLGADGNWVTVAAEGGGSSSLSGLTDTAISSPATGHLLRYSATDGKWHNVTLAALGAGTVSLIDTPSGGGIQGGPITTSGSLSLGAIAAGTVLGNITGTTAVPQGVGMSAVLDTNFGPDRGSILHRGTAGWTHMLPGTSGFYLRSSGPGADLAWASPAGAGTVQSVGSGAGLTGGPITSTGTLSLATIGDGLLLGNVSGGSTAPTPTPLTLLLDRYSTAWGSVLYRGASAWTALAPGQQGWYLQTRGAGANPTWAKVNSGGSGSSGTDTSVWGLGCDYATIAALPACAYSNGTSGVGATLTASANGALSVDGAAVAVADRLLVKNQANLAHNGVYVVTAAGSGAAPWVITRATDYDQPTETVQGSAFAVADGVVNGSTAWVLMTGTTVTIGTTGLEFEALTATLPDCDQGAVLGNPEAYIAPAIPTPLKRMLRASLGDGTAGQVITSGGPGVDPAWAAAAAVAAPKYAIGFSYTGGVATASQLLGLHRVSKAITIPANFGTIAGHASQAGGTAAATGSVIMSVDRALAVTATTFAQVGTITITAGSITPVFHTAGDLPINLAQGDVLRVMAPSSPDATLANFYCTLVAQES